VVVGKPFEDTSTQLPRVEKIHSLIVRTSYMRIEWWVNTQTYRAGQFEVHVAANKSSPSGNQCDL